MSGLAEGLDLIEVLRVRRGRIERLLGHARRMAASARALGFVGGATSDEAPLEEALAACVRAKVDADRTREGLVELRLAHGGGPSAALVTGDPFLEPFGPDALAAGVRLAVASAPRDEYDPRARHKTTDRAAALLARAEAQRAGADEALFLNRANRVACAAAANVFVLDAAGLRTPPLVEGALAGV